jgi:energy-coupling factor transporter ATP-binding protein EcfA2
MTTLVHHIVFTKDAQRQLNEKAMRNNTEHILGAVSKSIAQRGWSVTPRVTSMDANGEGPHWRQRPLLDDSPNEYRYELHFTAAYGGSETPGKSELRAILKTMNTRAQNPLGGRWTISSVDGEPYEVTRDGDTVSTKDFTAYAEFDIPADFETNFDHLYGLDSHIGRIKTALEVARMSQFANRYHVALIGKPGCGKSDICETLATVLGEDVVMKFDATATTAAGAIKQLDEAEILPRVLIVEEIEKVNAEALSFLLALMDMRGEIRKTTARSKIVKDTKILVIATVNNHELFDGMLAGALSSRFANKLWFQRPDEETIRRILTREVLKLDGDEEWIQPAIEYAREKNINDPRMITALCLCGRDGWLDGSFYKMLGDTDKPQDY